MPLLISPSKCWSLGLSLRCTWLWTDENGEGFLAQESLGPTDTMETSVDHFHLGPQRERKYNEPDYTFIVFLETEDCTYLPLKQTIWTFNSGPIPPLLDFLAMNEIDRGLRHWRIFGFSQGRLVSWILPQNLLPHQGRDPEGNRSTLGAIERGETEAHLVEGFTPVPYPDLVTFSYNHKSNGANVHLQFASYRIVSLKKDNSFHLFGSVFFFPPWPSM